MQSRDGEGANEIYGNKLDLDRHYKKGAGVGVVGREPLPEQEASVTWSVPGATLATDVLWSPHSFSGTLSSLTGGRLVPCSQVQSELLSGDRGMSVGMQRQRCGNRH